MDAIEWPADADLTLLGPSPEEDGHVGMRGGALERADFAEALRKSVLRMHSLTGNLHIGDDLCALCPPRTTLPASPR